MITWMQYTSSCYAWILQSFVCHFWKELKYYLLRLNSVAPRWAFHELTHKDPRSSRITLYHKDFGLDRNRRQYTRRSRSFLLILYIENETKSEKFTWQADDNNRLQRIISTVYLGKSRLETADEWRWRATGYWCAHGTPGQAEANEVLKLVKFPFFDNPGGYASVTWPRSGFLALATKPSRVALPEQTAFPTGGASVHGANIWVIRLRNTRSPPCSLVAFDRIVGSPTDVVRGLDTAGFHPSWHQTSRTEL